MVRIIAVPPFILIKRVVFKSAYFEMKDVEVKCTTHTHTHILLLSSGRNMTSFSYKSHLPLFLFSGDDCASDAFNGDFRRVNTTFTTYESPVNSECVAPQTETEKKRKQSFFFLSRLPALRSLLLLFSAYAYSSAGNQAMWNLNEYE